MTTFCQTLFTMTAAASVAALAVMILRLLLKKAPRWITCALWLVVFLRMVCPVNLDLPVSLMPASITSGAAAERVIPTTITPTVPETTPAQSAPAAAEEAEPAAAAPAANPEPASPGLDRNDFLFAVWVMGAAGMALWGAVSYLRLRRRISEAVRLEGNLYETDRIDTPFVCGFFRPRIYLPVGLDPTDRKYVVLHEQAHIRRKDHLTKPLAYLALCLHWFNPVLWLAFRLFCRDVETACDQAVIRNFDRTDTAGYAAALLHLGRRRHSLRRCGRSSSGCLHLSSGGAHRHRQLHLGLQGPGAFPRGPSAGGNPPFEALSAHQERNPRARSVPLRKRRRNPD